MTQRVPLGSDTQADYGESADGTHEIDPTSSIAGW